MPRLDPGRDLDHDRIAAWIEHMKGVYQRTIDKHAASGRMDGADIVRVRNHLQVLALLQKMLSEHHEMSQGQTYDAGRVLFGLETIAELIKPNGEIIPIRRRRNGNG
jgi:hypothetical protein